MLLHPGPHPPPPNSWLTPVLRRVAKVLGKCQGRSFRFPNFVRIPLSVKITNHGSSASEFAQAALLAFLSSLRAPSETLQLVRSYASDALDTFLRNLRRR